VAEEMKITHGSALACKVKEDELVEMITFENAGGEALTAFFV